MIEEQLNRLLGNAISVFDTRGERLSELDGACRQAIAQIHERRYDRTLRDEGRDDILAYGITFYKKRCRVLVEKMSTKRKEQEEK